MIHTGSIDYVVKIAHAMLYSRDEHDRIEAREGDKLLFVLARRARKCASGLTMPAVHAA